MSEGNAGGDRDDSSIVVSLHEARRQRMELPVTFHRGELNQILHVYAFMVAAGEWRDYAIDHLSDRAVFSVYRRASEMPLFQIVKTPSLARRQGAWAVISASGMILKRGHDLEHVLAVFDKKLRVVQA